jgi:6-phosphofructokinase 1
MGRHTGWIAVAAGIAGGADVIMIPEVQMTIEEACEIIKKRHARGKDFSIVVVSEGVKLKYEQEEVGLVVQSEEIDAFGHVRLGGVGNVLGKAIEKITGFETRVTVLGHVQRGGTPTSRDRMLATRFGIKAADMVRNEDFGHMVALRGDQIHSVPLAEAVAQTKQVPKEYWDIARTFFG